MWNDKNIHIHRTDKYSKQRPIIWPVWLNGWVFVYQLSGCRFGSSWSELNFRFHASFQQELLNIQAIIECGFTLKRVPDMIRTYSKTDSTDKSSQKRSVIWSVELNAFVFVYQLSACRFKSKCSQSSFRFQTCFDQGVPSQVLNLLNVLNYSHSETRTWYGKKIQWNATYT